MELNSAQIMILRTLSEQAGKKMNDAAVMEKCAIDRGRIREIIQLMAEQGLLKDEAAGASITETGLMELYLYNTI